MGHQAMNEELAEALRRCCKELKKIIDATRCGGTIEEAYRHGHRVLVRFEDDGQAVAQRM
jgi:hypothetical protein